VFSAVVYIGLYLQSGFWGNYFIFGIFSACLIIAGIVDLRIHLLPNIINAAGIAAAFMISVIRGIAASHATPVWNFIAGAAACGVPLFLITLVSKRGMGMGDVKFAALIGAFLGVYGGLCALWLSVVLGGVFSAALIVSGKASRKTPIPFGPFMALAALAMVFFGDSIKGFISAAYHV